MTIRAPYITPQKDILGPTLLSITTASLALTAVVAAVLPFNNSASLASTRVSVARSAPDQVHTDISKFTNPIPFAGATSGSIPFDLVGFAAPAQAYNPNLYATVAASPFIPPQYGSALSLNSLPTPPRVVPYNQLVYSGVPFSQSDWPRTVAVRYNPPQAQPYNVNLFGETLVPFNVTADLVRTPNFVHPVQNYNLNLYGAVVQAAAPFAQYDWSKPQATRLATPQFASTNINLFTNSIPFALYDWNKPSAYGPSKAALPTSSVALLTAVQAPPFVPVDYSKPYFPRNQIDATRAANPSSFTNPIPFAQYDWAKVSFRTPRAPEGSVPPNLNFLPPGPPDTTPGQFNSAGPARSAWSYQYDPDFFKGKKKKLKKVIARAERVISEVNSLALIFPELREEVNELESSVEKLLRAKSPTDILFQVQAVEESTAIVARMIEDDDDDVLMLIL